MRCFTFLLVVAGALALPAFPASGQIVYRDAEGVTHLVDSFDQVPPEYRAKAGGSPTVPGQPSDSPQESGESDRRPQPERAPEARPQQGAMASLRREVSARVHRWCAAQSGGEALGGRGHAVIQQVCDHLRARCSSGDARACRLLSGE
jgi:hypothetical protein